MPSLRRGRSAARNAAEAENLECPLCMELPTAEVHQCDNGHLFCGECLTQHRQSNYSASTKCPTCRTVLGDEPVRNADAEQRIGRLPGSCDGCGTGMLRKDLVAHMAACEDVVVECPFPGCSVRVARRALAAHMIDACDAHVQLAQAHHKRLVAAESALASLTVNVELLLYSQSDYAASNWGTGEAYAYDNIELKVMEPIDQQAEFLAFFWAHDIDRSDCSVDIDCSKTPLEIGIENLGVAAIHIGATIPSSMLADAEPAPEPDDAINLKTVTESGFELFFKCRMTTTLDKLMRAYCMRQGVAIGSVRFLFDGQRISPEDTPHDLNMEDGDTIDVLSTTDSVIL